MTPANEDGEIIESAPEHKVNLGLRYKSEKGHYANLTANYVGDHEYGGHVDDYVKGKVEAYTILNLRIGCMLIKDQMEIGVSVINLLDTKHVQYAPESILSALMPEQLNMAEEIGRKAVATVSYKF